MSVSLPHQHFPVFSKPLRAIGVLRHVIVQCREKEGLTREELAERIGVLPTDIERMESGDFSSITAQKLFDTLMALRIDLTPTERPRPTAVDAERESYARRFRERP